MKEKNSIAKELFKTWVNDYTDQLYSWAYHKTSSKEMAEDLVQDTFLSAYKNLENFKNESNPKTWLLSILNNKIIDFYRKKSRSFTQVDETNEQLSIKATDALFDEKGHWLNTTNTNWENDEHLLDNLDFKVVLENCINHLPEKWKIAVLAKYHLDKNADDICKELGLTNSNYWQIIHRAKLQLKICIEKNWNV